MRLLAVPALLLSLAACGDQQAPIDIRAISAVQAEIKNQVSVYVLAANQAPIMAKVDGVDVDLRTLAPEVRRQYFWCGNGNVDYDIRSVKAELQTSLVQKVGASFGFSPPVPLAPTGTIAFSRQATNSQTLDYTLWPVELRLQGDEFKQLPTPTLKEIQEAPIAQVLLNLRNAQIFAAMKIDPATGNRRQTGPQACFSNFNMAKPGDDPKNSYSMGLTVTVSVDGSVSVGVAALKAGVSAGGSTMSGHSLTVSFIQRDVEYVQLARDAVDKKCAAPKGRSPECMAARKAYDELIDRSLRGGTLSNESRIALGLTSETNPGGQGVGVTDIPILREGGGGYGVMRKQQKFDF